MSIEAQIRDSHAELRDLLKRNSPEYIRAEMIRIAEESSPVKLMEDARRMAAATDPRATAEEALNELRKERREKDRERQRELLEAVRENMRFRNYF
jgi:hypothetical protein